MNRNMYFITPSIHASMKHLTIYHGLGTMLGARKTKNSIQDHNYQQEQGICLYTAVSSASLIVPET